MRRETSYSLWLRLVLSRSLHDHRLSNETPGTVSRRARVTYTDTPAFRRKSPDRRQAVVQATHHITRTHAAPLPPPPPPRLGDFVLTLETHIPYRYPTTYSPSTSHRNHVIVGSRCHNLKDRSGLTCHLTALHPMHLNQPQPLLCTSYYT